MIINPHKHGSHNRFHKAASNLENRLLKTKSKLKDYRLESSSSLRSKSTRLLAGAGLVGTLLLSPPQASLISAVSESNQIQEQNINKSLASKLEVNIPHTQTSLTPTQNDTLTQIIFDQTGIKTTSELDGNRLNYQTGFVGYEQHLVRFPGDSISEHDEELQAGIAPGRGAFGYFTNSKNEFSTRDYLREKYYFVAQLHLLPGWNQNYKYLKDWYKFRKMIMINPTNGKAVVGVLGDAGPAEWTGKHFGASPETMVELELITGKKKGLVLLLFVDDPDNLIPLGPVKAKF
jgi:hypothetical protein